MTHAREASQEGATELAVRAGNDDRKRGFG